MSIGCPGGGSSLFGTRSQYIKTNGNDIIAVDGSNTRERLIMSDVRVPYKQILKSRIILKAGQVNYLLNHLGLGDNATFLALKAVYDVKSVNEEDNYVSWMYYNDLTKIHQFAQMMVLGGNSTHRVPQLYLTNPNATYPVYIDVMAAVIDDEYSYFTDTLNQSGTSFTGLELTDIKTYVIGQSIVIYDKSSPVQPLIYLILNNINSIERSGVILILDDSSYGTIFLQFIDEYNAVQAQSLLNYVLENPNTNIDTMDPVSDSVDPVLYFYVHVGASASGDYIYKGDGSTSSSTYSYGFNTDTDGPTFSTSISLSTFGTASGTIIDRSCLNYLLVDHITDNRDGEMVMMDSNLIITGTAGVVTSITNVGTYSLTFDFSDIAENYLDGIAVNIDITS